MFEDWLLLMNIFSMKEKKASNIMELKRSGDEDDNERKRHKLDNPLLQKRTISLVNPLLQSSLLDVKNTTLTSSSVIPLANPFLKNPFLTTGQSSLSSAYSKRDVWYSACQYSFQSLTLKSDSSTSESQRIHDQSASVVDTEMRTERSAKEKESMPSYENLRTSEDKLTFQAVPVRFSASSRDTFSKEKAKKVIDAKVSVLLCMFISLSYILGHRMKVFFFFFQNKEEY